MPKVRHYCNNKDFTACVVQYQEACEKAANEGLPQPQMPKYIGECITNLCWRLTKGRDSFGGFDFGGYTYHDEMVNDAIERCIYAVLKFDAKKTKAGAFAYMTRVAINAKKKRLKDEKHQHAILHKNFQTISLFNEHLMDGNAPDERSYKVVSDYDAMRNAKKSLTIKTKTAKMPRKVKKK